MPEPSYSSGDDYVVEFLGFRFSFNAFDFEQRVTAAAVKLGLVEGNDLDEDEVTNRTPSNSGMAAKARRPA